MSAKKRKRNQSQLLQPPEVRKLLRIMATDISTFPPSEIRQSEIWEQLPEEVKLGTQEYWTWLGKYLGAYFAMSSNPLSDSGLPEVCQQYIEICGRYYTRLYEVLFSAEPFIKESFGESYPFNYLYELFYAVVFEDFLSEFERHGEQYWESLSGSRQLIWIKETAKFWQGEISPERAATLEKWVQEDIAKRHLNRLPSSNRRQWNHFCQKVFDQHRKQLYVPLSAWGDATEQLHWFFSSHQSPACDRLKQLVFVSGTAHVGSRGKKRRPPFLV